MTTRDTSDRLTSALSHITSRDWLLLQLLDEHRVLTTDQLHRLLFRALRTCQIRLAELRALGLLERFRYAIPNGTLPWRWTLGVNGRRLRAAVIGGPAPSPRAASAEILRVAFNPHVNHQLMVNELFVRLAVHARHDTASRLLRWWPERRATEEFQVIRPDGHGIWTVGDQTTGFFVECDLSTESLAQLTGKLRSYERLAATNGPRYPVLFWLSSPEREEHLQAALRRDRPAVPVATVTLDQDPAGPVWLPADGTRRVTLTELRSFHGLASAANPNFRDGQLRLDGDTAYPWA